MVAHFSTVNNRTHHFCSLDLANFKGDLTVINQSTELGVPVALLLDTKGPEIRLGDFATGSVILPNKEPQAWNFSDGLNVTKDG